MKKWKPETYMESMLEQIPLICRDIVKLPMLIDLYIAYGEYQYGIFQISTKSLKRRYRKIKKIHLQKLQMDSKGKKIYKLVIELCYITDIDTRR